MAMYELLIVMPYYQPHPVEKPYPAMYLFISLCFSVLATYLAAQDLLENNNIDFMDIQISCILKIGETNGNCKN